MRRRAKRSRRPRSNRTHDWVIGGWATDLPDVIVDDGTFITLPIASLLDITDIAEHENHLTVLRVIGDLHFMCPLQTPATAGTLAMLPWMILGIKVSDTDTQGHVDPNENSLSDADGATDIEKSWMWLWSGFPPIERLQLVGVPETNSTLRAHPSTDTSVPQVMPVAWTIPIDIHVKRKMGERQELVLWMLMRSAQPTGAAGNSLLAPSTEVPLAITFWDNVRVLVAQGTAGHGPAALG